MTVYWRGEPIVPKEQDNSCSLCGHKDFRACGCPWKEGFADVPTHWLGKKRYAAEPGWPADYLQWVSFIAPCRGRRGWKK
jgi:hypothetical protein